MSFRLRYIPGTNAGVQFATIRWPLPWRPPYTTREKAEQVLAAMPDPSRMEVVEED